VARHSVLILAGGYATRLRPLTYTRPKPMLPILDKPLLDYILESSFNSNPETIYISLRYLADYIISHVSSKWGNNIHKIKYLVEDRPLGDAGPINLLRENRNIDSTLVVVNGDIFSNIDIAKVLEFHRKMGGVATIVLTRVEGDLSKYGVAEIDDRYRITKFVEKPKLEGEGLVNAGVYIFEPEALELLPRDEKPLKISLHLMPRLISRFDVYAYVHMGYWFDIGTPEDYLKANMIALEEYCRDLDRCLKGYCEGDIEPPCYIGEGSKIERDSEIGPYTIILSNVNVRSAVKIRRSIIMSGTIICKGSLIESSIIGERVYVGKWVRIDQGSVIGDYAYIADTVHIGKEARIGPHREVEKNISDREVLP